MRPSGDQFSHAVMRVAMSCVICVRSASVGRARSAALAFLQGAGYQPIRIFLPPDADIATPPPVPPFFLSFISQIPPSGAILKPPLRSLLAPPHHVSFPPSPLPLGSRSRRSARQGHRAPRERDTTAAARPLGGGGGGAEAVRCYRRGDQPTTVRAEEGAKVCARAAAG